ncbi:prolipoprotein diacylglyceryl transferase [Candidatus Riflebacteria bacterium]
MYPIILNHPIKIHSYGLFLAIAFAGAILFFIRELKKRGKSEDLGYDISFWVLLISLIGARTLFIYVEWSRFAANPWVDIFLPGKIQIPFPAALAVWKGGLVYYGGLIGGILAVVACSLLYGFSILEYGDYIAPGLVWGQLAGRIGCFLNGCCYGGPTAGFTGVIFPLSTKISGSVCARHPTQLYSVAFFCLALFLVLKLLPKRPFHGAIFFGYTAVYSIWRFLIEFIRDDPRGGFFFPGFLPGPFIKGFSISQCISILLFILSLGILLKQRFAGERLTIPEPENMEV